MTTALMRRRYAVSTYNRDILRYGKFPTKLYPQGCDKLLQTIKQRISCVEYAQRYGLNIRKSGDRTTSLGGGSNDTALVVYDDWFYDFKLSRGGDVIDLCAILKYGGDKKEAIHELADLTGVELRSAPTTDWVKYTQNLNNKIQKCHENIPTTILDYLHNRGITDETLSRLKIGYDEKEKRIVIPYWKNGYICYTIARATELNQKPKYKKAKIDGNNENVPWGLHTLDRNKDLLVICEGAFDAISFEQEGFSVLATMGGFFSKPQIQELKSIAKSFKQIMLTFDNDTAGISFTKSLSEFLFQNHIQFITAQIPASYKDISEYYEKGGDLNYLVQNAQNGISALCKHITDKDEFKKFAFNASRFIDKPDLAELFHIARENLSDEVSPLWFQELRKKCFSAPSENQIANMIIEKHKLRYIEELGFYEYTKKNFWERKNDTEILSYIGDELGNYRTGSRARSILTLIKADTITTELFNQKPLFNFINGTLDLKTLEFRPHSPADLCSMQVPYIYNPDARSEKWENFIEEISAYDSKRIALLQEIAGYILFPNCELQKCFFLLGDGANGKSVYLDIITHIFGEEQTSNIELSSLTEPFQRIQLLNSILNISSETKSDVHGCESIFKQVVVGDRINGCYKNKNFISFNSRAKFLFATNEIISARDITFGLERRICFIKFPMKFIDDPDPHNQLELKANKNLTNELLSDLPAIFNWCLTGYKILLETKSFTQTDDEQMLLNDFRETINPIYVFIKDTDFPSGFITNNELYDLYREWCDESGHKSRSRTSFLKTFSQSNPEGFIPQRTMHARGYIVQNDNENDCELI